MNDIPALESRRVRTHPCTVTSESTGMRPASASAIRMAFDMANGLTTDGACAARALRAEQLVDRSHRHGAAEPALQALDVGARADLGQLLVGSMQPAGGQELQQGGQPTLQLALGET